MGFMFVMGPCVACQTVITFHPDFVPSIRVNGVLEPLCKGCFHKWNEIHRTSVGLEPIPLDPRAYEAKEE